MQQLVGKRPVTKDSIRTNVVAPHLSPQDGPICDVGDPVQVEVDVRPLEEANLESADQRQRLGRRLQHNSTSPGKLDVPTEKEGGQVSAKLDH